MTAQVQQLADRVENLLQGFEPRDRAEELVRTLVSLYGEALGRILAEIRASPAGDDILERLCADPFVASLLLVHDLHPIELETRIERALETVRPYIHSHGGEVRVMGIHDGIVDLQLSGTCDGCPASSATMKLNIERAIRETAPEIIEVRAS